MSLRCSDSFQFEKLWRELVSNVSSCIRIDIIDVVSIWYHFIISDGILLDVILR